MPKVDPPPPVEPPPDAPTAVERVAADSTSGPVPLSEENAADLISAPATPADDLVSEEIPVADFAPRLTGYAPAQPMQGAPAQGYVPPPPQGYPPPGYAPPGYPPPGYGYPPPGYGYPPTGYGYPPPGYGYPPPGYGYPPQGYFPPAALPYQPHSYPRSLAPDPGRLPVHLMLFGIISIVWGAIALIVHIASVPKLMEAYKDSIPPPVASAPAIASISGPAAPYDGDVVGPRGFNAETRKAVVAVVEKRLKLSPDRSAMFEWFLADAGQDIFGNIGTDPAAIDAKIKSTTSNSEPDHGADLLETTLRRVVILDNNVSFRADPDNPTELHGTILTAPGQPPRYCSRAIKMRVEAMRPAPNTYGRALTPQQVTTLVRHMAEMSTQPSFRHLSFTSFYVVPIERLSLQRGGNPWVSIQDNGQRVRIYPDGHEVSESAFAYGTDADGNPMPPPRRRFTPADPGSLHVVRLLPYQAMVNAALALLLLISGIALVARISGACRIHRLWAYLRLIVSVGSLALTLVWASSLPLNAKERDDVGLKLLGIVVTLGYPLILLGALSTTSARKYFAHHQTGERLLPEGMHERWRLLIAQPLTRFLLLFFTLLAAVGCFLHGAGFSSRDNDDATKVSHAIFFAVAAAVLVVAGRGLLSAALTKQKTAAAAAVILLLSSNFIMPAAHGADPSAAQQPAIAPATRQYTTPPKEQIDWATREIEKLKQVKGRDQNWEWIGMHSGPFQFVLGGGSECQRVVFEAIPTLDRYQLQAVVLACSTVFKEQPIEPAAHSAAIAAIPALTAHFQEDKWTTSSAAGILLRKIAELDGAAPKLLAALKRSTLPPIGIGRFLAKTGASDDALALLQEMVRDETETVDRRASASGGLAMISDKGRDIHRSVIDGSHPFFGALERFYQQPDPDPKAQARHDESTQVRIKAMAVLKRATGAKDLAPATTDALARALLSHSIQVRAAAAEALTRAGRTSIGHVIRFFGEKANSEESEPIAAELAKALGYPADLLRDQKLSDAATRKGLAAVFGALATNYDPTDASQNIDLAASSLRDLLSSSDPETARQSAILMRTRPALYGTLFTKQHARLVESPVAEVSEVALFSVLSKGGAANVSRPHLVRALATKDDRLRELVVSRLRDLLRGSDEPPSLILPYLDSPDAKVRAAAATLLSETGMRRRLGPVTLKRLDEAAGNTQTAEVIPNGLAERNPWPPPPVAAAEPKSAPAPVETSAAGKGPWPAGYATLAAVLGVLGLGIVAMRQRRDESTVDQISS